MVHITVTRPTASTGSSGRTMLLRLLAVVGAWGERRRQRRALAELPGHLLRDIGLSPGDAWAEVRKPFWRG